MGVAPYQESTNSTLMAGHHIILASAYPDMLSLQITFFLLLNFSTGKVVFWCVFFSPRT